MDPFTSNYMCESCFVKKIKKNSHIRLGWELCICRKVCLGVGRIKVGVIAKEVSESKREFLYNTLRVSSCQYTFTVYECVSIIMRVYVVLCV